jgi:hypothetical protein
VGGGLYHEVEPESANVWVCPADGVDTHGRHGLGGRRAQGQISAVLATRLAAEQCD